MTSLAVDEQVFELEAGLQGAPPEDPAGAAKTFGHYDPARSFLLPPSLDDWLPEAHTARSIAEAAEDLLDVSAIYTSDEETSGAPPYDPGMMLKLLPYGYSVGVTTSREIERRCVTEVALRWLSSNQAPAYGSIARFRRRHLGAMDDLFTQTVAYCAEAGLVKLDRVALDGTKLRASASRCKAMSCDRMGPRIDELKAQAKAVLEEVESIGREEDARCGEDRRGGELPEELATKERRLAKLRAAKEALEAEAKERTRTRPAERAQRKGATDDEVAQTAEATPDKKAQRNFTDPESRMVKTTDGFHYAYNAQVDVDECSQAALATHVSAQEGDVGELFLMVHATEERLDRATITARPRVILTDAGYCSEDNLRQTADAGVDVLVATGRPRHGEQVPDRPRGRVRADATRHERMARHLRTQKGRADCARRKATVEPAFGQMKVRRRAGFLRLSGLEGATGEWTLYVVCHNLRRLANASNGAAAPA